MWFSSFTETLSEYAEKAKETVSETTKNLSDNVQNLTLEDAKGGYHLFIKFQRKFLTYRLNRDLFLLFEVCFLLPRM